MARTRPAPAEPGAALGLSIGAGATLPATGAGGAAGVQLGATPVETAAAAAASILAALGALATIRLQRAREYLFAQGAVPDEVDRILGREVELEREFRQRSSQRVRAGLRLAAKAPDPSARAVATEAVIERERQFAEQRSLAQVARLRGAINFEQVRTVSPDGAYWQLGRRERHCAVCLALGGRIWPWEVLDLPELRCPIHYGCGCSLRSIGSALQAGLVRPGQRHATAKDAAAIIDAVRQQAQAGEGGFMAQEEIAEPRERRVLAELHLREQLTVRPDVDLNALAVLPLAEDFDPNEPRNPHTGEWIKMGRSIVRMFATPARSEREDATAYYATPRWRQFEGDVHRQADDLGIEVQHEDLTQGIWSATPEPSATFTLSTEAKIPASEVRVGDHLAGRFGEPDREIVGVDTGFAPGSGDTVRIVTAGRQPGRTSPGLMVSPGSTVRIRRDGSQLAARIGRAWNQDAVLNFTPDDSGPDAEWHFTGAATDHTAAEILAAAEEAGLFGATRNGADVIVIVGPSMGGEDRAKLIAFGEALDATGASRYPGRALLIEREAYDRYDPQSH